MNKTNFKSGDKFILELGERRLDEYEIAGTDLYVKIYLLKKLTPYNPEVVSLTAEVGRKKGEWIYDGKRGRFPACKCSICGHYENADWAMLQGVNFCPNCGAEMKGE